MAESLEIRQLCFSYPGHSLFNHFSFTAENALLLFGKNGSGKTTMLRLIAKLISPVSGDILLNGNLHYRTGICLGTGALVQNATVFTHVEWLANLMAGQKLFMNSDVDNNIENSVSSILQIAGLSDYANYKIEELSCGLRKMVAIITACFAPADLVVIDEAFYGLDMDMHDNAINIIKLAMADHKFVVLASQTQEQLNFPHSILHLP